MYMKYKIKEMIQEYESGKSLKDVAKIHGCAELTVRKKLAESSIKIRKKGPGSNRTGKLKVDLDYFSEIDTNEKAYWLGFLYADGYIGDFTTKLKLKDREPIVAFKKAIKSEHKLAEYSAKDKRTNKIYKAYVLAISSQKICQDLKKIGLSGEFKNFEFPKIKEQFYSHFIRGLFDGDGGICFINKDVKKTRCDIIMSEKMSDFLCSYLPSKIRFKEPKIKKITDNENFKIVCLVIRSPKIEFLDWIYKESLPEIRLDRKYQKYIIYKNYLQSPEGISAIKTRSRRKDYWID